MDNYTKGAVEEYLERNREILDELVNNGIIDQSDIESMQVEIRQSIEKDLLTDNAYATLLMELEARKRKIDDSNYICFINRYCKDEKC